MIKISNLNLICILLLASCCLSKQIKKENSEDGKWVYCSEEDRISDVKSYVKNDDMLCLKKHLNIHLFSLSLKQIILNKKAPGDDGIGYNILEVKKNGIVVSTLRLEKENEPFSFITGFVKIREGRYIVDIDKDGIIEFAFVNYGTERNRFTQAKIYSLLHDGKIKFYGNGTYNKVTGGYVLFGCPNCHTINPEACKSCY
jgi:hypothetical protein